MSDTRSAYRTVVVGTVGSDSPRPAVARAAKAGAGAGRSRCDVVVPASG